MCKIWKRRQLFLGRTVANKCWKKSHPWKLSRSKPMWDASLSLVQIRFRPLARPPGGWARVVVDHAVLIWFLTRTSTGHQIGSHSSNRKSKPSDTHYYLVVSRTRSGHWAQLGNIRSRTITEVKPGWTWLVYLDGTLLQPLPEYCWALTESNRNPCLAQMWKMFRWWRSPLAPESGRATRRKGK